MNERQITYDILKKVIIDNGYANLLMRNYKIDNFSYITNLVYGVLRNYDLLCYQYKDLINKKCKKEIEILLNIGVYELYFTNTENYAILNEIVELANKYDKGFVNAILHKISNRNMIIANDEYIKYSIPLWIYNLWNKQYGKDIANELAKHATDKLSIYYRLNTLKASFNDVNYQITKLDNDYFTSSINLIKTKEFKEGLFIVQDYGTNSIVNALNLDNDMNVLDMCSAPGTKTSQIAAKMCNTGKIIATDLHHHRVELINNTIKKLGINNVITLQYDHCNINNEFINKFDRILLDAPCSGLGVLSRKPEIKFKLTPNNLDEIIKLQSTLLDNAYLYLKKGGIIVYSTCTMNTKENQKQIIEFLNKYNDLELLSENNIFGYINNSDSFYYAQITKK